VLVRISAWLSNMDGVIVPFVAARSSSRLRAAYLSLLYMGATACAAGLILTASREGDDFFTYALLVPGLCAMAGGTVCAGVMVFRCWTRIDRYARRVTSIKSTLDPGAAVALAFISVVNLFGAFIGLGRLPRELNQLAQALGLERTAPRDLGYLTAIMLLCSGIPVLGIMTAIVAALIFMPVLVCSCSSLSESIEATLNPVRPPEPAAPIV